MREIRKLQETVGGTYIITIPKEWADEMQISKGSMVNMDIDNGSIIISNSELKRETEAHSIDISNVKDKKALELSIISSYILGHDITELFSSEPTNNDWKDWVKEALKGLIGIEISEEYSDRILLQNLIDPYKFNLFNSMEKFLRNSMAVLSDSIISLQKQGSFLSNDAYNRGKELIRTYRLLFRLIILAGKDKSLCSNFGLQNLTDTTLYTVAIREMGRISYYAMRTAQHSSEFQNELSTDIVSDLLQIEELTSRMVLNAFNSLVTKDISKTSWVMDSMIHIRQLYEKIMESKSLLNMEGRLTISLIVRDLRAIAGYAVALADDSILGSYV
jgi:phosphate uptake regulator